MKLNFRKVATVLASAAMLGSTLGFAAASYPTPFVSVTGGDVGVVLGAAGAPVDTIGASAVSSNLAAELSSLTCSGAGDGTTIVGEAAQIKTGSQELYYGDQINDTKGTLTKNDLPTVLGSGVVIDEDGKSYDYTQKIKVPNCRVNYTKTSDTLDEPVVYLNFETTSQFYETQVTFPTAVNTTKLCDETISIFGKTYTFHTSCTSSYLSNESIILYGEGVTKKINSGESATVNVDGTDYTIEVDSIESTTTASIVVNGKSKSVTQGSTYKIAGLDVYVKDVIGPNVAGETRLVELWLGTEKMTLANGSAVALGTTDIDGTEVTLGQSSNKVKYIKIKVTPYSADPSVKYMKEGESFTDPVFGTFKIDLNAVTPGLESEDRDKVVIKSAGEKKMKIEFTNKAGSAYSINFLTNTTTNTTGTSYYAPKLAVGSKELIANATGHVNVTDYFITESGGYSQIWQLTKVYVTSTKNYINVKEAVTGSETQKITLSGKVADSTADLPLADGSSATLTMKNNKSDAGYVIVSAGVGTVLYTEHGLGIELTDLKDNTATTINASHNVSLLEETSYNDGIYSDNGGTNLGEGRTEIEARYKSGQSGNDIKINVMTAPDGDTASVGDYDNYYVTKYGTFIKLLSNSNSDKVLEVYYPSAAAHYDVFVSEIGATISSGGAAATGCIALGDVVVMDSEVASVEGKNLIVVGGPCINTVAAKLLGSEVPVCGADFTTLTGVGADQFLVQVLDSPYTDEKVAMLVAGWEGADTRKACTYVTTEAPATDVGTILKKVSATYADVVATA